MGVRCKQNDFYGARSLIIPKYISHFNLEQLYGGHISQPNWLGFFKQIKLFQKNHIGKNFLKRYMFPEHVKVKKNQKQLHIKT